MSKRAAKPRRLALTGAHTIRTIDATCSALRAALAEKPDLALDCSAVEEADLTLVQAILAARASAEQAGGRLALSAPVAGALHLTLQRSGLLDGSGPEAAAARAFWLHATETP